MPAPAFSQLWAEESEELFRLALAVPNSGVIVDIGTAQGGSSFIFHQATHGRHVSIHTYDPQPSREAYTNLAGTGVEIRALTSVEGAKGWPGMPVDLLFVDGSHHLLDVVNDYNAWAPFVKPGATVAFHDYDPVERGGLIHLGVKVALDAMVGRQLLKSPTHVGRVISGQLATGTSATLEIADAVAAMNALAARVRRSPEEGDAAYPGWLRLIQDGNRRSVPADNLTLAYLLERALTVDRSTVLELTRDRRAFFKWEEALDTLDHSNGQTLSLDQRFVQLGAIGTLEQLSAFVAREQVRLVCLARIFHAVTQHEL